LGHIRFYHRLRGSSSTIVMMTSKANGKTEICRYETPKTIEAKTGLNDYAIDLHILSISYFKQVKLQLLVLT